MVGLLVLCTADDGLLLDDVMVRYRLLCDYLLGVE